MSFLCTEGGPSDQKEESSGNGNNQQPKLDGNHDMDGPSGVAGDMAYDMRSDCPLRDLKYNFNEGYEEHKKIHHIPTNKISCSLCRFYYCSVNRYKIPMQDHRIKGEIKPSTSSTSSTSSNVAQ